MTFTEEELNVLYGALHIAIQYGAQHEIRLIMNGYEIAAERVMKLRGEMPALQERIDNRLTGKDKYHDNQVRNSQV